MASPMPVAPMGIWGGNSQARPPPPPPAIMNEPDEYGVQIKTMGLKVTYTIADSGESFLARHPQLLSIQTVPIDERRTIGMVDLRLCAQAVVRCSPELLSDVTRDFTVYAYDYSEPDEPMVGQGLLGWIVNNDTDRMIIGRVTRNPLSMFSNGVKDILEIKFKLKPVAAMTQPRYEREPQPVLPRHDSEFRVDPRHSFHRSDSHMSADMQLVRSADGALTPSGHAEWNSFMQSNPQMGNQQQPSRVASPLQPPNYHEPRQQPVQRSNSFTNYSAPPPQQQPPPPQEVMQPQPQQQEQMPPQPQQLPMQNSEGPNRVAPTPVDTATETLTNPPSRPSSRASNQSRKSKATGRPRGRPRKQPRPESQGNTSGYEDGTDGDEGPAKKKRATMTQVSNNINTPFGGGPESLRVAASTSGSIRSLRPMGAPVDTPMASHMQDVPRAPTPVPDRSLMVPQSGKAANGSKLRRQSTLSQAATPPSQPPSEVPFALSPSQQDGRSPDSEGASPTYSDDSPAAIGSSPPVPRTVGFVRSSPPASSPILPPMHMPHNDSGFMSGGVEDLFEDDSSKQLPQPVVAPSARRSKVIKDRRNRSGIPIQVFQVAPQPSSEADLNRMPSAGLPRPPTSTPSQEPTMPSLTRAVSDPRTSMPPPSMQQAEKESSPQQQEPVVAVNPDVEINDQSAPIPPTPEAIDGLEYGLERLAQAVQSMPEPALPELTLREPNLPEPTLPEPSLPEPTLPEPALPEPTLPEPALPEPALPEPRDTASDVKASFARPSAPPSLSRSASSDFTLALPTVPASDPIGPMALPAMPRPDVTSYSEAPCPASDALQPPKSPQQPTKSNKNYVKKKAIREKLLQAIENGQTPMYCTNCGAIETPTWRKIWTQEREGVPEFTEFSDKPGRITAILVLERDDEEKVTKYQVIKKALLPTEDKSEWKDIMLCNPCGIWLSKWKSHRPSDKWEKDRGRLNQQRRPRGTGRAPRPPRTKKTNTTNQLNPTSEAYFTTDPIGPEDQGVSPMDDESRSRGVSQVSNANEGSQPPEQRGSQPASPGNVSNPGSTHSRGSGTVKSPITLDDADSGNMGSTRRLLFPSPRKDGVPKILGELAVNIVHAAPASHGSAESAQRKETDKDSGKDEAEARGPDANKENLSIPDDDLESLFRSPAIARPSTPPPRDRAANNGPFKTPTRPTPSHRPITRSVTRSVSRSLGEMLRSPAAVRRTPTRTPRSAKGPIRRSPRLNHDEFAQMEMALEEYLQTQPVDQQYDDDMLEAMNRALAETLSASGTNFDITNMVLDSNCELEFGDLLGPPARSSPRARLGADHDNWDTWEANMRARHAADEARRE